MRRHDGSGYRTPTVTTTPTPKKKVVVALFTGFSGSSGNDIGMEQLRTSLPAGGNVVAKKRFGHSQQRKAVNFLKRHANDAEIVLVGHSFGGDSTIEVAQRLNKEGLVVKAIVQIDSVGVGDDVKPGNVTKGLNYWQDATGFFEPEGEHPVSGSTNVDAEAHFNKDDEITHTNIDNNKELHKQVIAFFLDKTLPTGDGVTPPSSPKRTVNVLDPLCIDALPGLTGKWDSGVVPLKDDVSLGGNDAIIVDVDFQDVVLHMTDTSDSSESVTVELRGTVMEPDQVSSDELQLELQFDDRAEELRSGQAFGAVKVSSDNGMGTFQQQVNLTDDDFLFGGFTLEIVQDGTGETQIDAIRVVLNADIIDVASVGGIVEEMPDLAGTAPAASGSSGPSAGVLAGTIAVAVAAGGITLGGAAWYARRRLVR